MSDASDPRPRSRASAVERAKRRERIRPASDRLPDGRGRALPDAREEFQRALPGQLVLRVHDDPQEREDVLDVALLEEARAGPDLVGNAPPRQLDLELQRLVVRPVENGEVGELLSLVVPLEQALADEAGLVGDVRQRDDGREPPGLAGGRELLGKLLLVVGDRGVGERKDLGRRTVVARQPEGLRLRVALREAEDVLERGAAERVDRLRVVADDRDVLLDARHPVDDLSLQTVGVLVLVDEDVIVRSTRAARPPPAPRRAAASTSAGGRRSHRRCRAACARGSAGRPRRSPSRARRSGARARRGPE